MSFFLSNVFKYVTLILFLRGRKLCLCKYNKKPPNFRGNLHGVPEQLSSNLSGNQMFIYFHQALLCVAVHLVIEMLAKVIFKSHVFSFYTSAVK